MDDEIRQQIEAIRGDHQSGAMALLHRALNVLERAAASPASLDGVAAELSHAQPSMAAFRTAVAIARRAADPRAAIQRLRERIERAPGAIARHTVALLELRRTEGPIRVVTCSASSLVETAIGALAEKFDVVACCAEGRPLMEGRGLAERLSARPLRVELYTDAGIGTAVSGADAVLVGADAIGGGSVINKVGTGGLCALANVQGVPAYVLAGREKILPLEPFATLELALAEASEVWAEAPPNVDVRNAYFEAVPLAWVTAVITETGVLQPEAVQAATLWQNLRV